MLPAALLFTFIIELDFLIRDIFCGAFFFIIDASECEDDLGLII